MGPLSNSMLSLVTKGLESTPRHQRPFVVVVVHSLSVYVRSTPGFPVHHYLPYQSPYQTQLSVFCPCPSTRQGWTRDLLLPPTSLYLFPHSCFKQNSFLLVLPKKKNNNPCVIRCTWVLCRIGEGEGAGREAMPDTAQPVTVPLQKRLINFQLSLVPQSCPTLCDPMDCTPGLPVHHQLLELVQTHVH